MQNSSFLRLLFLTLLLIAAAFIFSRPQPLSSVPVTPSPAMVTVLPTLQPASPPAGQPAFQLSPQPTITLPPVNIPRHADDD